MFPHDESGETATPQPAPAAPGGSAPGGSAPLDETAQLDALRAELDEATRKGEEYLDLLRRTRADFANYRRRVDEERAQQAREASLGFIVRLLPVLDDFERALGSARPEDLETDWARGIQLIERNLRAALSAEDVHRIDALGVDFDPWQHEAVFFQPSAAQDDGKIVQVVRPGYRKGNRVIRPAQVAVGRSGDGSA